MKKGEKPNSFPLCILICFKITAEEEQFQDNGMRNTKARLSISMLLTTDAQKTQTSICFQFSPAFRFTQDFSHSKC